MPALKEPWFFAEDMRPRFNPPAEAFLHRRWRSTSICSPGRARAAHRRGILVLPVVHAPPRRRSPRRSHDARIIAILREPASFLRSLHLQLLQSHIEVEKDLGTALALERAAREGRQIPRRSHRPQLLRYSDHVRYVEQLRRYQPSSPPSMLVLIYDDFNNDNEATVAPFCVLGVDETVPSVSTANPSMRCARNGSTSSCTPSRLVVGRSHGRRGPPSRGVRPGGCAATRWRSTRRRIVYGEPLHRTRPDAPSCGGASGARWPALSDYLGRDLVTLWGYDELD